MMTIASSSNIKLATKLCIIDGSSNGNKQEPINRDGNIGRFKRDIKYNTVI